MAIRIIENRRGEVLRCKPAGATTFSQQDRERFARKGWEISPITEKFLSETAFPPAGRVGEVDELDD